MQQTNTNIQVEFIYGGVNYKYIHPYNKLDRNYDDESYAYFLEHIPNTECGLFEINILKEKGEDMMIEDGYVAIYSAIEQIAPDTIIEASIAFV